MRHLLLFIFILLSVVCCPLSSMAQKVPNSEKKWAWLGFERLLEPIPW